MAASGAQTQAPQPTPWGMSMSIVTVTFLNGDTSFTVTALLTGMSKIHHVSYAAQYAATAVPILTYSTAAGTITMTVTDPGATKTIKLMVFGEV